MNYIKPLTPTLRRKIDESIERQLTELSECQNTSYVSALRTGLKATKNLIYGLPDGFPIPIKKERLIDAEYLTEHVRACMKNDRLLKTATKDEILRMIEDVPSS